MNSEIKYYDFVPQIVPQNMSGTINYRIVIKKDYSRVDGTNALYLNIFQNGQRRRLPLGVSIPLKDFDIKKQRVKSTNPNADGYNMIIGKMLGDLNEILITYKLSGKEPSMAMVIDELVRPTSRINFNEFAISMLYKSRDSIRSSTFRQQKGSLSKIKKYQDPIRFSDIDNQFVQDLRNYCRIELLNKPATVESTIKTLKKFVHMANSKGIVTPINYRKISVKQMNGRRVFLLPEEVRLMYDYYGSKFINESHRLILKRYLFSCFTGIRLSDSERLSADNFIGDHLALQMQKTDKFIRIKLNETAKSLIDLPEVFPDNFTREYINRELKIIAKILGIKKRIYFHSSRHTFATNFLMSGGDVVHLQKILGHSKIQQTMIYSHIVESITDNQISLLDSIVR